MKLRIIVPPVWELKRLIYRISSKRQEKKSDSCFFRFFDLIKKSVLRLLLSNKKVVKNINFRMEIFKKERILIVALPVQPVRLVRLPS